MKLSVIIPSYRRHELTARHFEYCLKATHLPDEIIVVNDGGDPGLKEMLLTHKWDKTKTKVIYAEVMEDILWNYNGACNLGFWLSTGDVIALEDADHIPLPEAYRNGFTVLEDPKVDRVTFARISVDIKDVMQNDIRDWVKIQSWGSNQMVGMFRRDLYLKLKGQDEGFARHYGYMAYDWPARYKKAGMISKQTGYYFAVVGDGGEPGLQRGLSPENRRRYRTNCANPHYHGKWGLLNFEYKYEVL